MKWIGPVYSFIDLRILFDQKCWFNLPIELSMNEAMSVLGFINSGPESLTTHILENGYSLVS